MKTTTRSFDIANDVALTNYVRTSDRMAALAREMEDLQKDEKRMRPAVLAILAETPGRAAIVGVNNSPRRLQIVTDESIGTNKDIDENVLIAAARTAGVKVSERSPEYIAPATFRAAYLSGLLQEFGTVKTTERVEVLP